MSQIKLKNKIVIQTDIDQHSVTKSIALHLMPGLLLISTYILMTPTMVALGLPSIVAFIIAAAGVAMPFEIVFLLYQGRNKNGAWSLKGLLAYQEKIPNKHLALYTLLLTLWGGIWLGTIPMFIDYIIIDKLFFWLPSWFNIASFVNNVGDYSSTILLITLCSGAILTGLMAAYVEELYYRGYLLPRIAYLGKGGIWLNSVLFSLNHFHTPWGFVTRIFFIAPMVYITWLKKDLRIAIWVHCILGVIGMLSLIPLIYL